MKNKKIWKGRMFGVTKQGMDAGRPWWLEIVGPSKGLPRWCAGKRVNVAVRQVPSKPRRAAQ